jgi:hypothetical protein
MQHIERNVEKQVQLVFALALAGGYGFLRARQQPKAHNPNATSDQRATLSGSGVAWTTKVRSETTGSTDDHGLALVQVLSL